MQIKAMRWYRSKKYLLTFLMSIILCSLYYVCLHSNLNTTLNAAMIKRSIENRLEMTLRQDKGTGCEMPKLNPFAKEITRFEKKMPDIACGNTVDWVKCYIHECRVLPRILKTFKNVKCIYRDIIYVTDMKYYLGEPVEIEGAGRYTLESSDHVRISCGGKGSYSFLTRVWDGLGTGIRKQVHLKPVPEGRENTFNVLIMAFDSVSHNAFIRKMPKSLKFLKDVMGATILNSYNIIGDGTPAALFPILTGKNEWELPDVRRVITAKENVDVMPFLFYKLRDLGYRTAYFEDMPQIGTFTYRFNGFKEQPTHHYLRALLLERSKIRSAKYCVGDTPGYELMMNITEQIHSMPGNKFTFSFVADICHDDPNLLSTADEALRSFLQNFLDNRWNQDTLLMVMSDHGARFSNIRETLQGKLEERLPFFSILLPDHLKKERANAQDNLQANVDVLTNPHDIYATILDVLDLRGLENPYTVKGTDLRRGLTLLEPIPTTRSCSEAAVEPHWCACARWQDVHKNDPLYERVAWALIEYINDLTQEYRAECVPRVLLSVGYVMKQTFNRDMLTFKSAKDPDGYTGQFNGNTEVRTDSYQIKITVEPGNGVYEASLTHHVADGIFVVDSRTISRINAYGDQPSCISDRAPTLNKYCYCKNYKSKHKNRTEAVNTTLRGRANA